MDHAGKLTPEEFWARMYALDDEIRADTERFPLYGVADWPGSVMLGDWQRENDELTTVGLRHLHGEHSVHVLVSTREPDELIRERRMAALPDQYDLSTMWEDSGSGPDTTATIPVDGDPAVFDLWAPEPTWFAGRRHGDHTLMIEATHIRPDELAVTRVHDIEPYLAGRRTWIRQQRGEE